MEEKKNGNKGYICAIVILVICVLGLAGYIVYDKVFNKPSEPSVQYKPDTNDNQLKNDEENGTKKVIIPASIKASKFSTVGFWLDKNANFLSTAGNRLKLVNMMVNSKEGSDSQIKYSSYNEYKAKYTELYGSNYSFDSDIKEVDAITYHECSSTEVSGTAKNVCWNALYGGYEAVNLTVTNESKVGSTGYKVSGTYNNDSTEGTFEIMYTIDNTKVYLKSLSSTCNKGCNN